MNGRSGWRPARDLRLRLRDLVERAAEMDRARAPQAVGGPRDGAIERPVDLEHARARSGMPRSGDRVRGGSRSPAIADAAPAASCRTARPAPAAVGRSDRPVRRSRSRPRATRSSAARASATPASRRGPSASRRRARTCPSDEPEGRRQRPVERQHRVRREPGEQRPRRLAAEAAPRQARRRSAAPAGRTGRARAGGAARGDRAAAALASSFRASRDQRPEQAPPGAAVVGPPVAVRPPWPRTSAPARPHGPPSSAWASGASGWMSSTPCGAQSIGAEERRGSGQRQDRRADVVAEPGERQFLRSGSRHRSWRRPRAPGPSGRRGRA